MNKYLKHTKLAASIVLILGLIACAKIPSSEHNNTLSGIWQVTTLTGEPTPDNQARLSFDPTTKQYSAYFGCNHFSGHYFVHQHNIVLSRPIGTKMMCSNIEDERTGMGTLGFVHQWRLFHQKQGKPQLQLLDENNQVRIEAIKVSRSSSIY